MKANKVPIAKGTTKYYCEGCHELLIKVYPAAIVKLSGRFMCIHCINKKKGLDQISSDAKKSIGGKGLLWSGGTGANRETGKITKQLREVRKNFF